MSLIDIKHIADEVRKINYIEIDKLCSFIYDVKICWGNYKNDDYLPRLFDILKDMPLPILLKVANIIIDANNQELDYFLIRILNEDKRISEWISSYRARGKPELAEFMKKLLASEGVKEAIAEIGNEGLGEILIGHYSRQKELSPDDFRKDRKLQRRTECILR